MPTGRPAWRSSSTRRAARCGAPPPSRRPRAGGRPSSARGTRRSARARARPRPERTRARRAERASAAARRRHRGPSLTIRCRKAALVGVGAHPLAPGGDRAGEPLLAQVGERGRRAPARGRSPRAAPTAGCDAKRSGWRTARRLARAGRPSSSAPSRRRLRRRRPRPPQRGPAPGRGWGPSGRSSPGVSGSPPSGRCAQTSGGVRSSRPSQNGQRSAASSRACGRRGREGVRALGAARREDRPAGR